jgi:putative flippase GtrA
MATRTPLRRTCTATSVRAAGQHHIAPPRMPAGVGVSAVARRQQAMFDSAILRKIRPLEGRVARALQFGRALIVCSGATLLDFALLTACIRILDFAPVVARVPALVAGASLQFVGHRQFTFRASRGALSRQAKLFIAVELVGLGANLGIYAVLLSRIHVLPPEALGFLGSFLVFVGWAYPMHRLVSFASGAACSR